MPYVRCGGCALRFYTAAAVATRGQCPSCGTPVRGRPRARGLDDAAFAALYEARAETLLAFFVPRVPSTTLAVTLWAETLAEALSVRHRYRGSSDEQAALWLEAIAYRQLARFRAQDEFDPVHLRRLGLQPPGDDRTRVVDAFREVILPASMIQA